MNTEPLAPENEVMFGATVAPRAGDARRVPPEVASAKLNQWAPSDNPLVAGFHRPLSLAVSEPSGGVTPDSQTRLFASSMPDNSNIGWLASPSPMILALAESEAINNGIITRATIMLVFLTNRVRTRVNSAMAKSWNQVRHSARARDADMVRAITHFPPATILVKIPMSQHRAAFRQIDARRVM
jgi:hypothetical protein